MSGKKRKKKCGNQAEAAASALNLIAAILNLIAVVLVLIEKLLDECPGEKSPSIT